MRTYLGLMLLVPLSFTTIAKAQGIVAVEENGHKVYVNDGSRPAASAQPVAVPQTDFSSPATSRSIPTAAPIAPSASSQGRYMYWSAVERRWKPVPHSSSNDMRNARSALVDVQSSLALLLNRRGRQRVCPASGCAVAHAIYVNPQAAYQGSATTLLTRSAIDNAINEAAARHHVDANLVRAVIKVESDFNPHAVSRAGAMGLMQLMPSTARSLSVENPFDPEQNVDAGVRHLKSLLEEYGGDVPLTLAAYNAGEVAVKRNRGIPPYAETRAYVRKITHLYSSGSLGSGAPIHISRNSYGELTASNVE